MRLKNIFGEDADVFRPERWLEAGEEERKRMEGVVGLCFGWGKYSCLGRRVAEVESGKVLVEVCELLFLLLLLFFSFFLFFFQCFGPLLVRGADSRGVGRYF
jgi:hypothetical protein